MQDIALGQLEYSKLYGIHLYALLTWYEITALHNVNYETYPAVSESPHKTALTSLSIIQSPTQ